MEENDNNGDPAPYVPESYDGPSVYAVTIRRALVEHGDPHDPLHKGVGCTYCQGALAALDALLDASRLDQAQIKRLCEQVDELEAESKRLRNALEAVYAMTVDEYDAVDTATNAADIAREALDVRL